MRQPKVYVKFPKAGLGNMMLTWSRAYVFAQFNELEMHTSSWTTIHWGALWRREKKSRLYLGYFKEGSVFKKIRFFYYKKIRKKIIEPAVQKLPQTNNKELFIFNKIFTEYDFFKEVRPYKEMVRKGIFDMLHPKLKKEYTDSPKPVIGLHIRRGDFKKGSIITPLSFFIEVVTYLRKEADSELPVTVFTDAEPSEIEALTNLDAVQIAKPRADILDILLLASSEIAVLSIGSSFSYWAAFLSKGKIIKHPTEWHVPFRTDDPSVEKKWDGHLS